MDMELKEIDREIERLTKLRAEAEKREAERRVIENHKEAVEIYDRLLKDLRRLDELNYLPPKIQAALTDASGKFNPGMYVKRPKAPSKQA